VDAPRYSVSFDSTDDANLDEETNRLDNTRMTLDEIRAVCERYRVRARYRLNPDDEIKTYVPPNERRVPFGVR
jgi:hypothetical protein